MTGSLERLLAAVVADPPPFYRDRVAAAGRDRAALARVPLTHRHDLLADQLAHLPHGTRRRPGAPPPVRAGVTGAGDALLVLTWSAADLACERAAGVRLLRRAGVAPGMRVANALPGALATPGSLLLGDVVEELGALDVPLGPVADAAGARPVWELIDRVCPDVLVLDAASGPPLLAAAGTASRPWWRGIVWLSAPAAPAPPSFAGWQRTWLAIPEATSFVAMSCDGGRLHVDEGVVAEIVDAATGRPRPPGEPGHLALTPLGFETPLLRYASEVEARLAPAPCPCGSEGPTIVRARGGTR
jgi:phenylacetate-CoA ligase